MREREVRRDTPSTARSVRYILLSRCFVFCTGVHDGQAVKLARLAEQKERSCV